jgi:autotransporter-associated beta strand protein
MAHHDVRRLRAAQLAIVTGVMGLGIVGAEAAVPITGVQLQSNVGTTVLPDFQGGTLRIDQVGATDSNAYAVENFAGNTIDEFGHTIKFTAGFSGLGGLTFTDTGGGGTAIFNAGSVVAGVVTIGSGATVQWGDGTTTGFLVGGGNAVTDNGALVMDFSTGISGAAPISGSGTLELKAGSFEESAAITVAGSTTIDSGATLQLDVGGSIANQIVDNGTLKFNYGAPVTFGNAVTGNGNAEVMAGTLVATGFSVVGGTVTIDNGATLQWGNGATGVFGGNAGIIDNGAFIANLGAGNVSTSIVFSGTGTFTVQSGAFTLTGTNTYTGTTTINPGATLQLGAGGTTGTLAGNGAIVDNGLLKFVYGGSVTFSNAISGSGTVEAVSGTTVVDGPVNIIAGTVTIDPGATLQWGNHDLGVLAGGTANNDNGALVIDFGGSGVGTNLAISGTGTVEIKSGSLNNGAVSTYSGITTIDAAGFLLLSNGGSISNSGGVVDNGVFDIASTTAGTSITTLSGAGKVSLGSQTLTLTNASGTFSGVLADGGVFFPAATGGGLTIALGTETLTGSNSFTGATTVNPGATLVLGNGGTTGTVAGPIADNGLLKFVYGGPVTVGSVISGSGNVEVASGMVVVTAISAPTGTVTIDNGATLR